jgi:hypothetical protein
VCVNSGWQDARPVASRKQGKEEERKKKEKKKKENDIFAIASRIEKRGQSDLALLEARTKEHVASRCYRARFTCRARARYTRDRRTRDNVQNR